MMYAHWFGHNKVQKLMALMVLGLFQMICPYPSSLSLQHATFASPTFDSEVKIQVFLEERWCNI